MSQAWGTLCLIHRGYAFLLSLNGSVIIASFEAPPGLEHMELGVMKVSISGAWHRQVAG